MYLCSQEMAWYDQTNVGSLASRLEADIACIRSGIGIKLAMVWARLCNTADKQSSLPCVMVQNAWGPARWHREA